MGKERAVSMGDFFKQLFQFGVYKGSQGKMTRQTTFAVLAIALFLGACRLFLTLKPKLDGPGAGYLIAGLVLAGGLWLSYRIVNYPAFADFLIAVEAEMNKVSWPTKDVLIRSSLVVIFVILAMAAMLFMFDLIWNTVFTWLGVVKTVADTATP